MNVLRLSRRPLYTLAYRSLKTTGQRISCVKLNQAPVTQAILPQINTLNRHGLHTTISRQNVKSFLLADIGEGITDCEVIQWFVEPGQTVLEFDKICEVQSDKATVEITSRYAGKVLKLYHNVHDIAKVGQPLVDIQTDDEQLDSGDTDLAAGDTSSLQTPTDVDPKKMADRLGSRSFQFPSVRRLATINDININEVKGTGKNGCVLKENIISHIESKGNTQENQESSSSSEPLENTRGQVDSASSLSMIQKAMYKTMTASLTIPQFGYKDEIELDAATSYRSSLNEHITKNSNMYPFTKISYLPIFVKSLSLALSYYPIMNACITGDQTDIKSLRVVYRGSHNIGVAMDTPQGLIVPNIKNVQSKTIFQVASEIHRLVELGKTMRYPYRISKVVRLLSPILVLFLEPMPIL
ncbi:unnamed protein product [Absidia cylindrospora]